MSMRVGITSKLFVAISAACILVAVTMGIAMRLSFERGFLGYLQNQSNSHSARLKQELEAAWAQHKSWDFTKDAAAAIAAVPELADARGAPGPPGLLHANGPPAGPLLPPPDSTPG